MSGQQWIKDIKIYGERHTNTNYLSRLIGLNLDVKQLPGVIPPWVMALQMALPGHEWVRDAYFRLNYPATLGWKHMRVRPARDVLHRCPEASDIGFISMTKNPYSWLLSLHRMPYHQYYEKKPSFEEFLALPWRTVGRENCTNPISNPIELWNIKNRSYLGLAALSGVNLTAEALLDDPALIIEDLSERFSIRRTQAEFINYAACTKASGKDYAEYRAYYLGEHWRESLSDDAIELINQSIDVELLEYYGYRKLAAGQ